MWVLLSLFACVEKYPFGPPPCESAETPLALQSSSSFGFSGQELFDAFDDTATHWHVDWDKPVGTSDLLVVDATVIEAYEVQGVAIDGDRNMQEGCDAMMTGLVVEAELAITSEDGTLVAEGIGSLSATELPQPGETFAWAFDLPATVTGDRLAAIEADLPPDEVIDDIALGMSWSELGLWATTHSPDGQHASRTLTRAPLETIEMAPE